jgi:hypothetical protein
MNRIDRLIEWLQPSDTVAVLRLLAVLEECGQMGSDEAAEWRRRVTGWAKFHALDGELPADASYSDRPAG